MPISAYSKDLVNKKIYTKVSIPVESPDFAVDLTDVINSVLIEKFKSNITSNKDQADCIIDISKISSSSQSLKINDDGLSTLNRVSVTLNAQVFCKNIPTKTAQGTGYQDYLALTKQTLQTQDLAAINEASKKALDDLIAKIVVQ